MATKVTKFHFTADGMLEECVNFRKCKQTGFDGKPIPHGSYEEMKKYKERDLLRLQKLHRQSQQKTKTVFSDDGLALALPDRMAQIGKQAPTRRKFNPGANSNGEIDLSDLEGELKSVDKIPNPKKHARETHKEIFDHRKPKHKGIEDELYAHNAKHAETIQIKDVQGYVHSVDPVKTILDSVGLEQILKIHKKRDEEYDESLPQDNKHVH